MKKVCFTIAVLVALVSAKAQAQSETPVSMPTQVETFADGSMDLAWEDLSYGAGYSLQATTHTEATDGYAGLISGSGTAGGGMSLLSMSKWYDCDIQAKIYIPEITSENFSAGMLNVGLFAAVDSEFSWDDTYHTTIGGTYLVANAGALKLFRIWFYHPDMGTSLIFPGGAVADGTVPASFGAGYHDFRLVVSHTTQPFVAFYVDNMDTPVAAWTNDGWPSYIEMGKAGVLAVTSSTEIPLPADFYVDDFSISGTGVDLTPAPTQSKEWTLY